MRKASAPRKLSPDVSRRLSDSRRESQKTDLEVCFQILNPFS